MTSTTTYLGYEISQDGIKWNVVTPDGRNIHTIYFEDGSTDEECQQTMVDCVDAHIRTMERDKHFLSMLLGPIELERLMSNV